jgi:hypothetical protein
MSMQRVNARPNLRCLCESCEKVLDGRRNDIFEDLERWPASAGAIFFCEGCAGVHEYEPIQEAEAC